MNTASEQNKKDCKHIHQEHQFWFMCNVYTSPKLER